MKKASARINVLPLQIVRNAPEVITLTPVTDDHADFDLIEENLRAHFRKEFYDPLLALLRAPKTTLKNAPQSKLEKALTSGEVVFSDGVFSAPQFSADITRELRALGALFDKRHGVFLLAKRNLPHEIVAAADASDAAFQRTLAAIDEALAKKLPEEIAGSIQVTKIFDRTLWKVDRDLKSSLKKISVSPELSQDARRRISKEWGENLELDIKRFFADEIKELRVSVGSNVFAGNRYESLIKPIQKSYGVAQRKAKFLASQETRLLTTKLKEIRYTDAGVMEYQWRCVAGSPNHPVRPAHLALNGKTFRWDQPPITTGPGEKPRRNNPGQDYNCRCSAIPIVRFKS